MDDKGSAKFNFPDIFANFSQLSNQEDKVCVVSILGKSSYSGFGCNKGTDVNSLIECQFFDVGNTNTSQDDISAPKSNMEGYYDPSKHVLYINLWSMYDTCQLANILEVCNKEVSNKDFYEIWQTEDYKHARSLLFLFLVSHIIMINHPGTSFDITYIRLFRLLDNIRLKLHPFISEELRALPISKDWASAGRMCSPRVLFAFETLNIALEDGSHPRTSKLSPEKKLAHSIEDQIYRILRKSRIITNISNNSLFAVPANQEFVHILVEGKTTTNTNPVIMYLELLQKHCNMNADSTKDKSDTMIIDSLKKFLWQHIELALDKGFDDNISRSHVAPIFEVPTLETWMTVSKKVFDFIWGGNADTKVQAQFNTLRSLLEIDSRFSENRCAKVTPVAEAAYQEGLPKHYTSTLHLNKLAHAQRVFSQHARGPAFEKCLEQLEADCEQFWKNGRQLCEHISLTGNPCVNQLHRLDADEETPESEDLPVLDHNSQFTSKCSCNCGRTQLDREDPFDMKDANYTFYGNLEKTCCGKLKHYDFPIFKSTTTDAKAVLTSPDKPVLEKKLSQKYVDVVTGGLSGLSLEQSAGSDTYSHQSSLDQHHHYTTSPTKAVSQTSDLSLAVETVKKVTLITQPSTTEYLPGMVHSYCPKALLPAFSSWSLVCLGKATIYNISRGLDQTTFLHGSNHLLPWEVTIKTDKDKWPSVAETSKKGKHRKISKSIDPIEHTVKLYVGDEYECPRGHRFFCSGPEKVIKVPANGVVKDNANKLLNLDMPLYFPCMSTCSAKGYLAQLMRIFLTTPESSSVNITLNPTIQPGIAPCPMFTPIQDGPIKVPSNGGLWVLRLPYIYVGDEGSYLMPTDRAQLTACRLLKGMFGLEQVIPP